MRKVILGLAVSLDGFIEGPNGEYDWCFTDQDYGMREFMKNIDAIFFGRKTYEMMIKAGGKNPFAKMKSYVFSNTLRNVNTDMELISGDVVKKVNDLKETSGKNIWLFGGAELTTSFVNHDLIDEYGLAIHPILLGEGKPLFQNIKQRKKLTLTDSKMYSSGLISLHYKCQR